MVEFNSGIPVYKQIINLVCTALGCGQLKEGDQLPTILQLHRQLQVNPNTVAKAYRELELRGVIVSERGSGSFVRSASQAQAGSLPKREREAKLNELWQKLRVEAAGFGISAAELRQFIQHQKEL